MTRQQRVRYFGNLRTVGKYPLNAATRGLLATDHVILNHGQVTWTTPELAPPSPNYHTTPTGGRFSGNTKQSVPQAMAERVLFQRRPGASASFVRVVSLSPPKSRHLGGRGLSCSGRKFTPTETLEGCQYDLARRNSQRDDRWRHHRFPPPQFRHGTEGEENILQCPALVIQPTRLSDPLI
ncbi:hypothetical protein TNCV_4174171 [Trichonephila clavipes]|nr:hypothetical protein TNCV_4174171 [Trichonephila clavipes]